jgi:hypothetical protein
LEVDDWQFVANKVDGEWLSKKVYIARAKHRCQLFASATIQALFHFAKFVVGKPRIFW